MIYHYRDVCAHPEGIAFVGLVFADLRTVVCLVNGVERWRVAAPQRTIGLKCWAAPDGRVGCAAQIPIADRDDRLGYFIEGDREWTVTDVVCASPLGAAIWHNERGFVLISQVNAQQYARWMVAEPDDRHERYRNPFPDGTSQGIRQILPDGTIRWAEDAAGGYLRLTVNGVTYLSYVQANGLVMGQVDGRTEAVLLGTGQRFLVSDIEGHDPRLTYSPVIDRWAATSWAPDLKEFTEQSPFRALDHIPTPVPTPVPTPTPGPDLPPLAPFERAIFFCPYFSYSGRPDYPDTTDYVGNMVMPWTRDYFPAMKLALIMVPGKTYDPAYLNPTFAYYLHVSALDDAAEGVYREALALPAKPIILYIDSRDIPERPPAWVDRTRTWPSFPAYRDAGESLGDFNAEMRDICARLTGGWRVPFVITPAFYDRNKTVPIEQIDECMPVYEQLIRDYKIIGIMPFADMRPGGMGTHPRMRARAKQLFAAIPRRPNRFQYWLSTNWKRDLLDKIKYEAAGFHEQEQEHLTRLITADLEQP